MPSFAECPPDSILRAVATGQVPEPLLGVYLEHVGACDACCAPIDRAAGTLSSARPAGTMAADEAEPWLGTWLDRLKRVTSPEIAPRDPQAGTRIGPFRIIGVLGTGGSAIVYEALDELLERPVVLKVLRAVHVDDPEQRRLVVSEARALANLQHEAIMPLLQLLWHDGSPVLVFPRLPGETLADALAAGRCPTRVALAVVRDVARALTHAHGRGIFHHDVKPSNIWLHRRGSVGQDAGLLFDFGLAGTTTLAAGTPGYCDPATSAASEPDRRDLFSLGVVLHECLGASPRVPPRCRDLVRRLTASDPDDRPRAADVADEIGRLLSPPRRSARSMAAILVVVASLAAAGAILSRRPAAEPSDGVALASGPIRPEAVIPGQGLPVAVSGDARTRCTVVDGPAVCIRPIVGDGTAVTVPLDFRPDRLAFNAEARRLAAAADDGHVAIVDVPNGTVTFARHFPGGVAWIGWSGWHRDALALLSGSDVQAVVKTRRASPDDTTPEWVVCPLRGDVRALTTMPGTEGVVSLTTDGTLIMWSLGGFTQDTILRPAPTSGRSRSSGTPLIGWKGHGMCFLVAGDRVSEFAPYQSVRSYGLPGPAEALVWPSASTFVVLTTEPGGESRLRLGDRSRPDDCRDFDVGGERIEEIFLLDDQRRVVATTGDGDVRIYTVPP